MSQWKPTDAERALMEWAQIREQMMHRHPHKLGWPLESVCYRAMREGPDGMLSGNGGFVKIDDVVARSDGGMSMHYQTAKTGITADGDAVFVAPSVPVSAIAARLKKHRPDCHRLIACAFYRSPGYIFGEIGAAAELKISRGTYRERYAATMGYVEGALGMLGVAA